MSTKKRKQFQIFYDSLYVSNDKKVELFASPKWGNNNKKYG